MPRSINSFDVFDTLIARRSGEPRAVLMQLEARANIPGLARHRLMADQTLGAKGQPYDLHAIWREVGRTLNLDAAEAARLMELEIRLEHEEAIPVAENMALVRDGDLLVSDSYLPQAVIFSLLRKAGLNKSVGLVVTNAGKFQGWIWPELLKQVSIKEHLGDNVHSDGKTAFEAGIRSVIYSGSQQTAVEKLLQEAGLVSLANLIREVRLANPMPVSRSGEWILWNLSCQLNFPLLVLVSRVLEEQARLAGAGELLFVSRDCLCWSRLFQRMFPERPARYLFTSRRCLLKPTDSYREYFRSIWRPDSLIVDLTSTGISWSKFFSGLSIRGKLWCIGRIDDHVYMDTPSINTECLEILSAFRASQLRFNFNKNLEMLNYGADPVVENVRCLPGGGVLPELAETLEYPPQFPLAAHAAFDKCLEAIPHYPGLFNSDAVQPDGVIRQLIHWISTDRHLHTIYSNHQAADEAYMRSILN